MKSNPTLHPLEVCVHEQLAEYFARLDGEAACNVHEMVMLRVEKAVLAFVMESCAGNQTRAAEILGLNRNTLRKKLTQYELLG